MASPRALFRFIFGGRFPSLLALTFLTLIARLSFAQQHVLNPFAGATQYLNPDYTHEVDAAIAAQPSGSALALRMATVATYPTAVWIDKMAAITGGAANNGRLGLQQHIAAALAQQAGSSQPIVLTLVIYDLPDRDCAALASNGELSIAANPPAQPLPGLQTYEQDFITPIFDILQPYSTNPNIRFVLVIEDDSLPNMITNTGLSFGLSNCIAANNGQSYPTLSMQGVYVQGIQYALNQFHQLPNVYNYLDVGHHGWLGWPNNFNAAVPFFLQVAQGTAAGVSSVDGFITNTANYGPTKEPFLTAGESFDGGQVYSSTFYQYDPNIDEEDYAAAFDQALIAAGFPPTLGFLIDTSRNGWGGPQRPAGPANNAASLDAFVDAGKIDERDDMGQWCNQENSGLGVPPTVNPGYFSNLLAYVWIKPPGESDGNYPGSVYNGVTSTAGDPNCDPAHSNALANGMLTGAIPNSPPAGTFFPAEFSALVTNAFPAITVAAAPNFTISALPRAISVAAGATGTSKVSIGYVAGLTGTVSLTASFVPGVSIHFSPSSVNANGTVLVSFSVPSGTAAGTSTVTLTGANGAIKNKTHITLTIPAATQSFTLAPSASSLAVTQGTSGIDTIAVTQENGFTGSVTLALSGLPSGVTAAFATNPTTGSSVLRFNAGTTAAAGTSILTITGTSGTLTANTTVALTVSVATGGGGGSVGAGYWHTSGNQIVDANGNAIRMAGVNWYGFETTNYLADGLWAQDYKTVLNTIKSLGYNVVRIPFSNQVVESNPVPAGFTTSVNGQPANTALVGQTSLEDLDTLVSYAGSIGLHIILDNHRSEAGSSNEANGLWYTSAYPQANWIADWQTLATRYSASQFLVNGNPTVIGFDLRNEPHLGTSSGYTGGCWTGDTTVNGSYTGCPVTNTAQNWPVAAQLAGNAIQAINPNLLIFVEGNDCYDNICAWEGEMLIGVASNPVVLHVPNHLVYSAHDYGPNLFAQPWFTATTTQASLNAIWNQFWGYIVSQNIAPVWLGEFGTTNVATDIENTAQGSQGQWFEDLVAYLQANPRVNWTYWALNGEDTYGLLDSNYDATPASALKQSLLAGIQFPPAAPPAPGFTLAASAAGLAVTQGAIASDTITVTGLNGFTGGVTLAASGLPNGVTATFGTNPVTGSSVLSLTATSTAAVGAYTVTVTGSSGSLKASATIALAVTAAGISGFACHIGYTVTNQWPGGFGAALTINNTGTVAISSWTLTWTWANSQTITELWSGNYTQTGSRVSVTNAAYNGTIAAGASNTGTGFNGTWNNVTNAAPTSFAVNGTACN